MTVEIAVPPTLADWINPSIAPRFFSGSASTSEALNIELPAQLVIALKNAKMQVRTKLFERKVITMKTVDVVKPIAIK